MMYIHPTLTKVSVQPPDPPNPKINQTIKVIKIIKVFDFFEFLIILLILNSAKKCDGRNPSGTQLYIYRLNNKNQGLDYLDIEGVEVRFCGTGASKGLFRNFWDRHTETQTHRHTSGLFTLDALFDKSKKCSNQRIKNYND